MEKIKFIDLLMLVIILVLSISGCTTANIDLALNGTWVSFVEDLYFEFTFKNGKFESILLEEEGGIIRGNYITFNRKIFMELTDVYYSDNDIGIESGWYSKDELFLILEKTYELYGWRRFDEYEKERAISGMIPFNESTYSVVGNILIFKMLLDDELFQFNFKKIK